MDVACSGYREWSRRGLLAGAGALGLSALSGAAFTERADGNVLVVVFLRGGWDGLAAVAPLGDDDYRRARPTLAAASGSFRLDDRFSMHPSLATLRPMYEGGRLAVLHAVGSGDGTRSHFEAMGAMERGANSPGEGLPNGWIARHLVSRPGGSPLRAVAVGTILPDSLRGAPGPVLLEKVEDYRLDGPPGLLADLRSLHAGRDGVSRAGRRALEAMDGLGAVRAERGPDTVFGRGMAQVATLVKAGVGLEVATVDMGSWDTHVGQGPWISRQMEELAGGLAAFDGMLGSARSRVTTVVMSEFGRRVEENAGLGTDHGRGTAMLVMGAGVRGGRVIARWPGLRPEDRDGPGDLRVTTDYRDVLAEVLEGRLGGDARAVFPGRAGVRTNVMTV